MHIQAATQNDSKDWIALRAALWPKAQDHEGDLARMLAAPSGLRRFSRATMAARQSGLPRSRCGMTT